MKSEKGNCEDFMVAIQEESTIETEVAHALSHKVVTTLEPPKYFGREDIRNVVCIKSAMQVMS